MNNQKMVEPICRIDYYTVVLNKCTIGSIFDKFKLNYRCADIDLWSIVDTQEVHIRNVMYRTDYFRLIVGLHDHRDTATYVNNMRDDWTTDQLITFFTKEYDSVKVEAAGVELNNMRKAGFDVEAMATDPTFWIGGDHPVAQECKLNRADIAFDFIDHPEYPNFPQLLAQYLGNMQSKGVVRLCTAYKKASGLVYSVDYTDKATCCYLGAKSSPEFLRVYDKLQEQGNKVYKTLDTNAWPEEAEFRGCKSWTRLEIQCRREKAVKLLYRSGSVEEIMMYILKYIFTNYLVTDTDHVPVEFLSNYYDISCIRNVDFV